jgi:hypothetical protein
LCFFSQQDRLIFGIFLLKVKITEALKVWTDRDGFHYDVRVGWSTNNSPLMLGEGHYYSFIFGIMQTFFFVCEDQTDNAFA